MTDDILNFKLDTAPDSIIKVVGVGGGGGNAVNHMYRLGIRDVDFIVCNTDSQALANSPIPSKVHLGSSLTEGRGAGNKPEIGRQAATENIDDVRRALEPGTKMAFITAGMGGGTGTGGAPVIAALCRELGLLTVGIVTIPFRNEGRRRIKQAVEGIQEMEKYVDSLLVINNERIREMYGDFSISQAFARADDVLATAAKGIAEIITVPGYINVDFADVETVMRQSGVSIMGTGLANGEGRAVKAVELALNSPLLNNNNIKGAQNILLNVTSGNTEVTMDEIGEITDFIQAKAGNSADLIWGNGYDEKLGDEISVTVIATGFSTSSIPEIMGEKKQQKVTHVLDGKPHSNTVSSQKIAVEPEKQEAASKQKFEFEIKSHENKPDSWESLYKKEEPEKEKEVVRRPTATDYSKVSEDDVDRMERVPAYVRKQKQMDQQRSTKDTEYSRYTVSVNNNQQATLRDNPYLHKNID